MYRLNIVSKLLYYNVMAQYNVRKMMKDCDEDQLICLKKLVLKYFHLRFPSQAGECKFSPNNIGSKVKGYLEIPKGDEQTLLKAVALIGPVAAGIDGFRQSFRHYK